MTSCHNNKTDRRYVTKTIRVCHDSVELTVSQDERDANVASVVWPCSLFVLDAIVSCETLRSLLSKHAVSADGSQASERMLDGLRILEIGSGTGAVAMALAALGASVTATDHAPSLPLLTHNVERFRQAGRGQLQVLELDWNQLNATSVRWADHDVLLLCECLFDVAQMTSSPVVRAIERFFAAAKDIPSDHVRSVVVAFEERDEDIETAVLDQLRARGLSISVVSTSGPVNPSEGNTMDGPVHYIILSVSNISVDGV